MSVFAVVTTVNGCVDTTATYSATRYAAPDTTVLASGPLSFCPGDSVTLTAVSGLDYLWSNGDTIQNVVLNQTASTFVVVTTPNGCSDTSATFATTLYSGADTTLTWTNLTFCASDSATITAAGGQSYAWNTGDTTQSITVNQTGNYAVTVTTVNGCVGLSDTVATTVVPDVTLPQILGNVYGWFASGDTVNFSVLNTAGYTLTWGVTGGTIASGQGTDTIQVIWGAADSSAAIWVIVSNGVCQDSASLNLVISGLGTGEGVSPRAMAFPNPNAGVFTLEWQNVDATQVVIYNGVGQVVAVQTIQSGSTRAQFDLSSMAGGVYRAVIYGKEGQVTLPVVLRH
ncbi:MAG: T9SS type A sorting domain-containing protein [Schleiferiaceae bacterium]